MRLAILEPLRKDHGWRLKLQSSSGETAATHALKTRLAWARQDWAVCIAAAARVLSRGHFLSSVSVNARNPWNARVPESLVRVNAGLQARAFALWSGGVYQLVRLLDPIDLAVVSVWAKEVYRNLFFLDEICAAGGPSATPALVAFQKQLMWQGGTVYRELFGLVFEGRLEEACFYAQRLHTSILHEKGDARDCPRSVPHLGRDGSNRTQNLPEGQFRTVCKNGAVVGLSGGGPVQADSRSGAGPF